MGILTILFKKLFEQDKNDSSFNTFAKPQENASGDSTVLSHKGIDCKCIGKRSKTLVRNLEKLYRYDSSAVETSIQNRCPRCKTTFKKNPVRRVTCKNCKTTYYVKIDPEAMEKKLFDQKEVQIIEKKWKLREYIITHFLQLCQAGITEELINEISTSPYSPKVWGILWRQKGTILHTTFSNNDLVTRSTIYYLQARQIIYEKGNIQNALKIMSLFLETVLNLNIYDIRCLAPFYFILELYDQLKGSTLVDAKDYSDLAHKTAAILLLIVLPPHLRDSKNFRDSKDFWNSIPPALQTHLRWNLDVERVLQKAREIIKK